MILHPAFPQDEVDKLLKQRADELKAAKDQPLAVIGGYFNAVMFGRHPYGRPTTGDERSVAAITRDDIVRFHADNYASGNLIVAVCGDFQTADMEKLLTAKFGAMARKTVTLVVVPTAQASTQTRMLLVDKPDATQTFFRFGNIGIARNDPDRVAVNIVNTLFGGRFTSLINTKLRIDSGLTYGASSSFDRRQKPGPFFINSYTRNATTEQAMTMALDVVKELHATGFTEAQLASAKAYIKGQYGPTVETSDQLANLMSDFEIYGLDAREVDEYAKRIDAVTMADMKRVIAAHFPEKALVFAVIGKASEIAPLMNKYSPEIVTRSINDAGFGNPKP